MFVILAGVIFKVSFVKSLLAEVRCRKVGLVLLLDGHLPNDWTIFMHHRLVEVDIGTAPFTAGSLAALLIKCKLRVLLLWSLHHRRLHLRPGEEFIKLILQLVQLIIHHADMPLDISVCKLDSAFGILILGLS